MQTLLLDTFSSVILVGVYIPPQANARTAINNLAASITVTENANQGSIVLALGDFTHTNLRKALPKYKQHVQCPTRDDKTLDHCYCTVPNAFYAVSRTPLGRSDRAMVYLIPTYMQKLKSDKPLKKTVKKWTQEAILYLQGCFDCTDWAMFSESCANQDEYADTVTSYVSFLQTPAFPQRLSQSMQMTNPGSQRTSNTNSLPKMMLSRTVIKTSTKQLNMKLRRLSEEQNHSTEISLKNSSQHPTAMLCGRASSESPSINRNQHLLTMTPPSQIN